MSTPTSSSCARRWISDPAARRNHMNIKLGLIATAAVFAAAGAPSGAWAARDYVWAAGSSTVFPFAAASMAYNSPKRRRASAATGLPFA